MAEALGVPMVDKKLEDAKEAAYHKRKTEGEDLENGVNNNGVNGHNGADNKGFDESEQEVKTVSSYIDFTGNLGLMG